MKPTDLNILVVDDNEIAYVAAKKLFSKHGYTVDVAEDGLRAMEKLIKGRYDILVTDLAMPNFTGQQLIEAVKRNGYKDMKIVVVSSIGSETAIQQAFVLGADDYITKPYNAKELLDRVHKLINKEAL